MTFDPKLRLGERVRCSVSSAEPYWSLVPRPLPPSSLQMENLQGLVERASHALGRLDGIATVLPDTKLFLCMYVRKEAVLSSQIEGTQSSLSDLLLYESEEAPGVPLNDVQEVSNYVAAMNYGLDKLRGGFPMSMRLIKEIHEVLMSGARGVTKSPGEFRRSQNWVGGSRPGNATCVPPPPERVVECMSDLEKFLHSREDRLPLMVRELGLSTPTVTAALQNLERIGIVREVTGKQRGRIFVYDAYLKLLEKGTEPLRSDL